MVQQSILAKAGMSLAPMWQKLVTQADLSAVQQQQFAQYAELLQSWNEKISLTTIIDTHRIIDQHFGDALSVGTIMDMHQIRGVVDIGAGAGFPGIPLKIKYPHLRVILIEVNLKKISFLQAVIQALGLTNIELFTNDWRTYLRTTQDDVQLFCTRAALPMTELLRLFKPGCIYHHAKLVYWASQHWLPTELTNLKAVPAGVTFQLYQYRAGNKKRQLVVLEKQECKCKKDS